MPDIFKFGYTIDDVVSKVYVFAGALDEVSGKSPAELGEIMATEAGDTLLETLFTLPERTRMAGDGTTIVMVNGQIHLDDTIETIKRKLILHCEEVKSFDEMYMFAYQMMDLHPATVYQNLTQNGKLELTRTRLAQFVQNVQGISMTQLPEKETYDYDDIFALDLEKAPRLVAKPIGQRFVAVETTYPYAVDPYSVTAATGYDEFLVKFADSITTTTNKGILMDAGPIHNNVIQLCMASDVLASAQARNLSQESSLRIYYPFLAEKGVRDLGQLVEIHPSLVAESAKMIGPGFLRGVENVNLFYDVNRARTADLQTKEVGIKSLRLVVRPEYVFNLPLDVVFKLLHATLEVPLIKYNPGKRQEKVYRMHADRIATNGKKIPSLSRAEVMKLVKSIGKSKSVAAYIAYDMGSYTLPVICEFESTGDYSVSVTFDRGMAPEKVNEIVKMATDPVVGVVKEFLSQSGYTMNLFEGLYADTTHMERLEYSVLVPVKKKINIKSLMGCLSSIFSVIRSDVADGAVMRYKRVSNYNEMDSSEAYVVEMINAGSRDTEIIQGLMSNFQLSAEEARERLGSFISRLQLVQDAFQGSERLRVKNNPGFLTTMNLEDHNAALRVTIAGVNDVGYLNTIPVYIDALVRMTQTPWASRVDRKSITALCKKQHLADATEKIDIVAPTELPQGQQKAMDIVAEELTFEEKEEEDLPGMMDVLMMSDSEDEDEAEDERDSNPDIGGAVSNDGSVDSSDSEDMLRDMTGMSLANPNPFFTRLKERDPTLFLVDNEGSFKSYSRVCPWNMRRQPVILNDAEKAKIDAEHPGSYTNAVKYGTSPDKQFWYICPKYWSLRDQVSLTEEQAKSGRYGSIIPWDAKKVPPGGNVFQFTTESGEAHPYPGFQKRESHPQKKCIPCCFKVWDSPAQRKRREACAEEERGDEQRDLAQTDTAPQEDYVVGPDKFPLAPGRYGYLPLALQKFLRSDNRKCQISDTNTGLKPDHPCILRFGVAPSKDQSFIGALAAIWADQLKGTVLSIAEMKEVLIGALDLDRFMALQNGNLVEVFDPDEDIDLAKYKDSKIYQSTDPADPSQMAFLRKVVRSYKNYLDYLRDDTVKIDYTYLWDLVCDPNPSLFKGGLNLAILAINQEDMTDNVQIICPSNHYASTFFDANRSTAIVLKMGDYFEPIFQFEAQAKKNIVTRRFSTKASRVLPNLRAALELIKRSMNEKCAPLPSMPKVYKFAQNISLERLAHLLRLKNYDIKHQILNYNGRVIAVLAAKGKDMGIIPCYPSSPMIDLDAGYKWLDEPIAQTYHKTLQMLTSVHEISQGKIPCKPVIKVLEDGLIVGVLTQTNQFVPVSPPTQDIFGDDLITVNDANYAVVDKKAITEDSVDTERIEYNKRIRLETGFFNAFRNTIRILLGQFKHRRIREEIESLSQDADIAYLTRLRRIDLLLRELTYGSIEFSDYDFEILSQLGDITSCYTAGESCGTKQFCVTSEDGACTLVIPNVNLINNQTNEAVYYGRLADEIVRYSRIKSFIFQPKAFLAFANLKYNLQEDELIILQSLLVNKPDYFEGLVPAPINSFVKYNTYDTAQPLDTQAYTSEIELDKPDTGLDLDPPADEDTQCPRPTVDTKVAGKNWRAAFPSTFMELVFPNDPPQCSFDLILTLIKRDDPTGAKQLTREELRETLLNEYLTFYDEHPLQILGIMAAQGKKAMAARISGDSAAVKLGDMIMSHEYYATNMDMWLLARRFNIPLVFYTGTTLRENGQDLMVAYSDGTDEYYFVKSPAPKDNEIPNNYRLLVAPEAVARIPVGSLSPDLQMRLRSLRNDTNLENFVANFALARRKKKRLVEAAPQNETQGNEDLK
jgi:hypothetical protein